MTQQGAVPVICSKADQFALSIHQVQSSCIGEIVNYQIWVLPSLTATMGSCQMLFILIQRMAWRCWRFACPRQLAALLGDAEAGIAPMTVITGGPSSSAPAEQHA